MKRLLILAAFVVALGASAPAGACAAASDDPCFNDPFVATVDGEVWWDFNGADGVRQANEHPAYQYPALVFADYNHDGTRQAGEAMVQTDGDGHYSLPVDTRRLDAGSTRVDVRMQFQRYPSVDSLYSPQCIAPSAGCVRTLEVKAGETTRDVGFPAVGTVTILGEIYDDKNANGRHDEGEGGVPNLRVFLDDNRNGKLDAGEPASYKTVPDGKYGFPIPTRYQAAGGNLPPLVLEQAAGADCTAPTDCAITGLHAESGNGTHLTASHGVARPAVIFIHGYGGARISCPGKNLWFNAAGPDLMNMRLGVDTDCPASVDGLLKTAVGKDIYGSSSDHFEALTWPGRHYDYVWDWRRSPADAVDGLDRLVEQARRETGVSRVQLIAHSMGGLVVREYIERPDRAEKIARAVTVGTPYLGSAKSLFALVAGVQAPNFAPMDIFTNNEGMKAASRTFPGHFSLLPAFNYGSWLSVDGKRLDIAGIKDYFRSVGVDPAMYDAGLEEHGRVLDHYADHGVDYQVIVGGGLPTVGSADLRYGIDDQPDTALVNWVSGDETVAAFAGAGDVPRDRLHYVCGQKHVPLTMAYDTLKLMDDFLIHAEPMHDQVSDCPFQARELSAFALDNLSARASQASGPRVFSGGRAYSLDDAAKAGLVQVLRFGGATKIVASRGDVRVELPAGGTATVRDISDRGAGPERRFEGAMTVALGGSGAVTRDGKALKPVARDAKPPRTTGRWRGGRLVLRAKDASGIAATYVIVGGKRRVYRKPVRVSRKARFASVDVWGNAEKPHR